MIDNNALRSISYGLYLISSKLDGASAGCTVNTLAQVTSDPLQMSVAINKDNATAQAIRETGAYAAVVLSEDASMELIGCFGFRSSRDTDKFSSFETAVDEQGIEYVKESAVARISVKVTDELDLGSHLLFIGSVEHAELLSGATPMTYAYYHEVKKGKTPPKASSYLADAASDAPSEVPSVGASDVGSDGAEEQANADAADAVGVPKRYGWRCTICGYIEEIDELPDDFVCPICGVGKEMFECIEL